MARLEVYVTETAFKPPTTPLEEFLRFEVGGAGYLGLPLSEPEVSKSTMNVLKKLVDCKLPLLNDFVASPSLGSND